MDTPDLLVVGQAAKRGVIPRIPDGDRLLADGETWLRAEYPDAVRSIRRRTPSAGESRLSAGLHPAAPAVTLVANDHGRVTASAATLSTGPGYRTFVDRLLERLGAELSISWPDSPFASRAEAEHAYLTWLGAGVAQAREARRRGEHGLHLGTPDGVRFAFDGALATPLGPRDDEWLDRAVHDPAVAIDVTPWWVDATDARYLLNRALCLMWTEVRWRMPADEVERAVLDETVRLLGRAFPHDPSLAYPWREWCELLDLRGVDEPANRVIRERARKLADEGQRIGYRREPVTVIHEGWTLEVPGSFAERRSDEEWWGGEGGRSITVAAVETGDVRGPMAPEGFLEQVAAHLDANALRRQEGELLGRAKLGTDSSSGVEVGVVEGYSAVTGKGAAIRVEFDDPADWEWALSTWRALAPA